MSFHDRYIANKIEENWDSFPYKLDYIMYIVFSNNSYPSDIRFKNENGLYIVEYIKQGGSKSEDNIDYKKYQIEEKELFKYLKQDLLQESNYNEFAYNTEIFKNKFTFRCSSVGHYLLLRFLDTSPELPSLFLGMPNKTTKPSDKLCQHFNNKVDNYSLYIDLNEKIPYKAIAEKKNKI